MLGGAIPSSHVHTYFFETLIFLFFLRQKENLLKALIICHNQNHLCTYRKNSNPINDLIFHPSVSKL